MFNIRLRKPESDWNAYLFLDNLLKVGEQLAIVRGTGMLVVSLMDSGDRNPFACHHGAELTPVLHQDGV